MSVGVCDHNNNHHEFESDFFGADRFPGLPALRYVQEITAAAGACSGSPTHTPNNHPSQTILSVIVHHPQTAPRPTDQQRQAKTNINPPSGRPRTTSPRHPH